MVYRWVGAECGLRKTEKMFSANNEQRTIKRGYKWFPENFRKKIDLENFRSESFSIRTSEAGLPHPSSCCKGEACLPRLHYKWETSSPKWCIEG